MNQFEIDVAKRVMYKMAQYGYMMEKDAGVKEKLLSIAETYTPTFLSAGKKGMKIMEKHLPTLYPMGRDYANNIANMIDDFVDTGSKVIKTKKLFPSNMNDTLKMVASPLSGFAAGASTSPFINIPLDMIGNKAKNLTKKIPAGTKDAFMSKLRSAADVTANGIDQLRSFGVKNTAPDNIIGLIPYSVGLAAGGTIPPEFYALPILTAMI